MRWKHIFMMIAGCALPLLFIFAVPLIGLNSKWSLFIFITAMFACHLLMPMHHNHSDETKKTNHETDSH